MHAMSRAEAAQLKASSRAGRALPAELRPQGSDRAAAVRVRRHHKQATPICATKPAAAGSGRSRPATSTSTRWHVTATSCLPRPWQPIATARAGGRTGTSSASTSCRSRPRATRRTPGKTISASYLDKHASVTIGQVARDALSIETPRIGTAEQRRIAAALEQLGWRRQPKDWEGNRWWVKA